MSNFAQFNIKEGFLTKRGHFVKSWKKRFFVLDAGKLIYYADAGSKTSRGTIELLGAEVRIGATPSFEKEIPGYLFTLVTAAGRSRRPSIMEDWDAAAKKREKRVASGTGLLASSRRLLGGTMGIGAALGGGETEFVMCADADADRKAWMDALEQNIQLCTVESSSLPQGPSLLTHGAMGNNGPGEAQLAKGGNDGNSAVTGQSNVVALPRVPTVALHDGALAAVPTLPPSIRIFSGTWNMAEQPPPKNLAAWLPPAMDVYSLSVQESMHTDALIAAVHAHLGPGYCGVNHRIGATIRKLGFHGHIAVIVFVKEWLVTSGILKLSRTSKTSIALGKNLIVTRAGNKGAVALSLPIRLPDADGTLSISSALVFLSCHLTSDNKGRNKIATRNRNAKDVLSALGLQHSPQILARARAQASIARRSALAILGDALPVVLPTKPAPGSRLSRVLMMQTAGLPTPSAISVAISLPVPRPDIAIDTSDSPLEGIHSGNEEQEEADADVDAMYGVDADEEDAVETGDTAPTITADSAFSTGSIAPTSGHNSAISRPVSGAFDSIAERSGDAELREDESSGNLYASSEEEEGASLLARGRVTSSFLPTSPSRPLLDGGGRGGGGKQAASVPPPSPALTRASSNASVNSSDSRMGKNSPLGVAPSRAYIVMAGDFNYRTVAEVDTVLNGIAAAGQAEVNSRGSQVPVLDVEAPWKPLLERDQMRALMRSGSLLPGFCEPPLAFPPSYRRQKSDEMKPKLDRARGEHADPVKVNAAYATFLKKTATGEITDPEVAAAMAVGGSRVDRTQSTSSLSSQQGREEVGALLAPGSGTPVLGTPTPLVIKAKNLRVPSWTDRCLLRQPLLAGVPLVYEEYVAQRERRKSRRLSGMVGPSPIVTGGGGIAPRLAADASSQDLLGVRASQVERLVLAAREGGDGDGEGAVRSAASRVFVPLPPMTCYAYDGCDALTCSDHMPISAILELPLRPSPSHVLHSMPRRCYPTPMPTPLQLQDAHDKAAASGQLSLARLQNSEVEGAAEVGDDGDEGEGDDDDEDAAEMNGEVGAFAGKLRKELLPSLARDTGPSVVLHPSIITELAPPLLLPTAASLRSLIAAGRARVEAGTAMQGLLPACRVSEGDAISALLTAAYVPFPLPRLPLSVADVVVACRGGTVSDRVGTAAAVLGAVAEAMLGDPQEALAAAVLAQLLLSSSSRSGSQSPAEQLDARGVVMGTAKLLPPPAWLLGQDEQWNTGAGKAPTAVSMTCDGLDLSTTLILNRALLQSGALAC